MIPRISIITATFNPSPVVDECFRSVASQEYPNLQHIVIDGGSSPDCFARVLAHRDRIDVLVHEPDRGISDAWNKGLRHVDGDIVALLNADDNLLPGALAAVANGFRSTGGRAILHGDVIREEDGRTWRMGSPVPVGWMIYVAIPVLHPATYVPTAAYREVGGFDEAYPVAMDYDFILRAHRAGWPFKRVPCPLVHFRAGGNSDRRALEGFTDVYRSQCRHGLSQWVTGPLYRAKMLFRGHIRPLLGMRH